MLPVLMLIMECIAQSKSMLLLAKSEQWDEFIEKAPQREESLRLINLENLTLSDSENEMIHAKMNELIELNQQLEAISDAQRGITAAELSKLRVGNKANKAYSNS